MEKKLPDGWIETNLGEIFEVNMGQSPPSSSYNEYGEGLPFYQGKAEFGDIYPTVRKYTTEPKKTVQKDTVLLSVRAPVGPTNLAPRESCIGRGLAGISSKIIPHSFIFYYFRKIESELSNQGTGTTFTAINKSLIELLKVPLPPLPEQKRIAAKLDELCGHIDALKTKLDRIPELLKNFRQQVLTQAVTGKLTEEWRKDMDLGEWEERTIDDLAEVISGFAFKSADFTDQGLQLIRMGNLYNNKLDLSRNPVFLPLTIDPKIIEKYTVKKGDVLLSMTGTKYKRDYGFAIEVKKEGNLLLNQRIVALRPRIGSTYLMYLLRDDNFRDQFFSFETGGVNQGNVGVTNLKSITLPIPNYIEQEEIVKRVEGLFAVADKIEAQYISLKTKIDTLPQAILNKAFKGELVPQNPNDEPASVLLERVKGSASKKKRTRSSLKP